MGCENADTVQEVRELPPFNRVAIEGFANLTLVQGGAESIAIEGAQQYLRSLRIERDRRHAGARQPRDPPFVARLFDGEAQPIHATLTFRTLDAISVEGAAKLRADRLETDRLAVSASGATQALRFHALDAERTGGQRVRGLQDGGRRTDRRAADPDFGRGRLSGGEARERDGAK